MALMRSLLYVPANRPRFIESAGRSGADVIVLDLEDSVPPSEKAVAREAAAAALPGLIEDGKAVHVRVNAIDTGLTRDDLQAVVCAGLAGIDLPKANGPQDVRDLDVLIREQETRKGLRPGLIGVVPSIESARSLLRCAETAAASTRLTGLSLGGFDFAADLGVNRTREGRELLYARGLLVTCAVASGIVPLDAVFGDINDPAGLADEASDARALGFKGKYVIHPSQVDPVNAVFAPALDEVDVARKIVAAFDEAAARGEGSIQVDSRMIDLPVAKRARALIAEADEISRR
jgi:citrate lyase subunit beta / citryl-CoA lyase